MNKGYAFGFLLVLLIVVLGLYVAYTGFMASREAQRAQSGPEQTTAALQAPISEASTSPASSPVPTVMTLPTPVPGLTATLTALAMSTSEGPEPMEAEPTEAVATEPPPVVPTDTAQPQVQPPTPAPVPAYQFRLAGPPAEASEFPSCCYILGTIRDAAGNGLEGVRVQVWTMWTAPVISVSKGGVDLGNYDIPIGRDAVVWNLCLVDAAGTQISSQVQIPFDPEVSSALRVDWVRTY